MVVVTAAEAAVVLTVVAVEAAASMAEEVVVPSAAGAIPVVPSVATMEGLTAATDPMKACAGSQGAAIPAHIGDGPGKAEMVPVLLRRAGIRLPDLVAAEAWLRLEGLLATSSPGDRVAAARERPTPRLPTGDGMALAAPAERLDRLWQRVDIPPRAQLSATQA